MYALANSLQAKEIVIQEDLPSGTPPTGLYYHAQNVTHELFDEEAGRMRMDLVRTHMKFFHDLIKAKLENAKETRDARNPARVKKRKYQEEEESKKAEEHYEKTQDGGNDEYENDRNEVPSGGIDGDIHLQKSADASLNVEEHRLKEVSTLVE